CNLRNLWIDLLKLERRHGGPRFALRDQAVISLLLSLASRAIALVVGHVRVEGLPVTRKLCDVVDFGDSFQRQQRGPTTRRLACSREHDGSTQHIGNNLSPAG